MPLTRIKSSAIGTDAITSARIDDGAVATVDIADQAVTLAKLEHGTSSNDGKFLRANNGADPTYETVNTDLVSDTSPQLGGALDAQSNNITGVGSLTVGSDLTVDTSTLKVDSSNNRVGMGVASPSRQVQISRSIADGSGELGIVSSDSSTSGALGNIHFGNSTDSSLASIRATADGATDSAKLEFNTEKTGAAIETAMRIDSNGRILKPLQPAFLATGSNTSYITTSPVPFPNVVYNIGSHYNNSNYTFTAPIAGRYFFHAHMGLFNGSSGAQGYPWFSVNGTQQQYSYLNIAATWYANASLTCVFNLSANDTVKITASTSSATYYNGANETRFMGFLVG